MPGLVVNFLEKKAVFEANAWLKRESEAKWAQVRLSNINAANWQFFCYTAPYINWLEHAIVLCSTPINGR